MSTTLLLARHGQTLWHAENRYAGVSDIGLTDEGRAQAVRLGWWAGRQAAAGTPIDAVWTSTVPRAIATAEPACRALDLVPNREHDLRECDFGVMEGRTLTEFESVDPTAAAAFRADPVVNPFPNAEDPRTAATRATRALHHIASSHEGGRVLVVAHNTLLRLALCDLLSIPLSDYRRVFPALRNAAVSEIRLPGAGEGGGAALLSLNVPCER
ncbi:histidine phosphatase family protein [Streptomyces niveus]|uniref:histidine phosphatase family protein n=1 Tax=Streptomyces niveus TaxID=193462 RepID=UPI0036EC5B9D